MLDQNIEISIILPTYNHAKYLDKSIKSTICSTKREFELIIINDGSKDNTVDVLSKYHSDPRIKIINQENIGIAESLNKGFKIARGNYLTWTSADNLYKKNALDKLANFLDDNPDIDLTYANVELIDDNSKLFYNSDYRIANQDSKKSYHLDLPKQVETLASYADNFINACFMYRSWINKALSGYRKDLLGFEDYEYWLRILLTGKISHIGLKEALYQYRVHKQSLTGKLNAEELRIKQRNTISTYYNLINSDNQDIYYEIKETKISSEKLYQFLISLPLFYKNGPLTKLNVNFKNNKNLEEYTPIDFPSILSRSIEANFQSHKRSNKKKCSVVLLIPDFIEEKLINHYINLIKLNPKIQFICLCTTVSQRQFAERLSKYTIVMDITKSPETEDQLLPEEKYLPFVYSLANVSLLICPLPDENLEFCARAINTLAAATNINSILITNYKINKPSFCSLKSWEDILSNKINYKYTTEKPVFNSWLNSVSSKNFYKKLINLSKLSNISLS